MKYGEFGKSFVLVRDTAGWYDARDGDIPLSNERHKDANFLQVFRLAPPIFHKRDRFPAAPTH
jgi:hypothetical protein